MKYRPRYYKKHELRPFTKAIICLISLLIPLAWLFAFFNTLKIK